MGSIVKALPGGSPFGSPFHLKAACFFFLIPLPSLKMDNGWWVSRISLLLLLFRELPLS